MQKRCTCRYFWEFYYCLLVKRREIWYRKDICGEWNVVEIQGEPVRAQSNPFIGFDTKKGRSIWI